MEYRQIDSSGWSATGRGSGFVGLKKYTIGIIENDPKFREYLRNSLQNEEDVLEVLTWSSAEEYLRDRNRIRPELLFIDIMLGGMNGVDLAGKISETNPEIKKVVLTNMNSEETIFNALRNGCLGYVLKAELEQISGVFRTIMNGGAVITPTIALRVLSNFRVQPVEDAEILTTREKQLLGQLACGYDTAKVAEMAGITINTMRNHIKNIYRKLNVNNRQAMMRRASELGFL